MMDFIDSDPTWPFSRAKTSVVRAAAAVIREQGPRAATLKNIASRAGITEPAIFRHFEGVDGLFEGLFFVFERQFRKLSLAFERPDHGIERLIGGARGTVEIFAASKDFSYLLLHAEHVFRGYENLRNRIIELRSTDQAAAYDALEEARALGEVRTDVASPAIAIALFGAIHLSVHAWIESVPDYDLIPRANERIDGIRALISSLK
jgi:AcrR family transcriptional regulator